MWLILRKTLRLLYTTAALKTCAAGYLPSAHSHATLHGIYIQALRKQAIMTVKEMLTEGTYHWTKAVVVLFWIAILTISGILSFDSEIGLQNVTKSLDQANGGFDAKITAINAEMDSACAEICDGDSEAKKNKCIEKAEDFKKAMKKLANPKDNMREIIRSGHVWYHFIHQFNVTDIDCTHNDDFDTGALTGLQGHDLDLQTLQNNVLRMLNALGDYNRASNIVHVTRQTTVAIFVILFVYFLTLVAHGYMAPNKKDDNPASPNKLTLIYWFQKIAVFALLLMTFYVLSTAITNDFFMEQIDEVCVSSIAATPADDSSRKEVIVDADSNVCLKESVHVIHDSLYYQIWLLGFFTVIFVATHFTTKHGLFDTSLPNIGSKTPSIAGQSKAAQRIRYLPLTSIHNR